MSNNSMQDFKSKKNRPAVKFRISMVVFIFIMTFVVFFIMHMIDVNINDDKFIRNLYADGSSSVVKNDRNSSNSSSDTSNSNTTQIINPVPQSAVKSSEYWAGCALVGDVTMLRIADADAENIPKANVFSASNINIENINSTKISYNGGNDTVINLLKGSDFNNIYIMLGSVGIETLSTEQMLESYTTFLKETKKAMPNAKIYVMSIPPVTEEKEGLQTNGVSNLKVDQFNSELLRIANSETVYFVDVNTTLKGNNGKLPDAFTESDNLTLKSSTYELIHDYILTHCAD